MTFETLPFRSFVIRDAVPPESTELMREAGSKVFRSGFFELDLTTGMITWANDYLTKSCVQYGPRLIGANVHAIVRESHRDKLLEVLSEATSGKPYAKTVWPVLTGDGSVAWWTCVLEGAEGNTVWVSCSFVLMKEESEMDSMASMVADAHFSASASEARTLVLERKFDSEIEKTREHMQSTIAAATTAANAALENKAATGEIRSHMATQFEAMTDEILRLISADARLSKSDMVHEEKMKVFEERVQKTTSLAVRSIVNRADEAGRGLSKRVTIPVSVIAAIVTFIQWVITNYKHQLSSR